MSGGRAWAEGLLAGATPGPWYWRTQKKADGSPTAPYLYSNTGGRPTVLDSVREGRSGSTLRFRVKTGAHSLMLTASEIGEGWAAHPDAALVAAAPDLARLYLEALAEAARLRDGNRQLKDYFQALLENEPEQAETYLHVIEMLDAALASAPEEQR